MFQIGKYGRNPLEMKIFTLPNCFLLGDFHTFLIRRAISVSKVRCFYIFGRIVSISDFEYYKSCKIVAVFHFLPAFVLYVFVTVCVLCISSQ